MTLEVKRVRLNMQRDEKKWKGLIKPFSCLNKRYFTKNSIWISIHVEYSFLKNHYESSSRAFKVHNKDNYKINKSIKFKNFK